MEFKHKLKFVLFIFGLILFVFVLNQKAFRSGYLIALAEEQTQTEVTLVISPAEPEPQKSGKSVIFIPEKSYFFIFWKGIKNRVDFLVDLFS